MFSDLNRRDLYKTYQYAVCQGKAKANWLSNAKKEKKVLFVLSVLACFHVYKKKSESAKEILKRAIVQ